MPRYIATLPEVDQAASLEAQTVVRDATAPMQKWINDSIDTLQKDFTKRIEESTKELEAQASGIASDMKTMRDQLESLLGQLSSVQVALPPGASPSLLDASKKAVKDVQDFLKQREDKWRGAGAATVKAIEMAAKGLTGI
jgi:hypothetical protein